MISKTGTSGKWLLSEVRGAVAGPISERFVDEKDSCAAYGRAQGCDISSGQMPKWHCPSEKLKTFQWTDDLS